MVRTSRNVKREKKEWGKRKESKKYDQKLALALLWSSSSSITQLVVVLPWRFQNRVVKTDWNTYIGSLPNRRKEHR